MMLTQQRMMLIMLVMMLLILVMILLMLVMRLMMIAMMLMMLVMMVKMGDSASLPEAPIYRICPALASGSELSCTSYFVRFFRYFPHNLIHDDQDFQQFLHLSCACSSLFEQVPSFHCIVHVQNPAKCKIPLHCAMRYTSTYKS